MNYNDPIINGMYIIASLIQFLLYCYFTKLFLKPKYKYSLFFTFIGLIVFLLTSLLIESFFLYKSLVGLLYVFVVSFVLYDGTFLKKFICSPIILICSCIDDIFIQFILVFIFDYPVFYQAPYPILFIIYILSCVLLYILLRLVLQYFDHRFSVHSQYFPLFINLVLIDFVFSIIIAESLILSQRLSMSTQLLNKTQLYIIYIILFMIALFLILKTYYQIKSLKQNIALELTIQQLHTSYLKQLEDYIYIKDNDESIKYLRHDIMNYLQTIQTYQQRK